MGDFAALNQRQKALCRESGVDPEGMSVILENENTLRMLHHKTRNLVTIHKGESQRRKELHGN